MEEKKSINFCRFYENKYPKNGDIVVVEVVNVEENASYVSLLEYNRIQGMISPNELTQAYKQSIHKALKLNKQEVARVLRVDEEKGYIDLSKKQVEKQDELICLEKFNKSKQCNAMLVGISEKLNIELEKLYEKIIWPLFKNQNQHPLDSFLQSFHQPEIIDNLQLEENVKTYLIDLIKRRLQPQKVRVKADFELFCPGYEGVNAIKAALKSGVDCSQKDFEIKFIIVGSPKYSGTIETSDKVKGIQILEQALKKINEEIQKYSGRFDLLQEPRVYGDRGQEEFEYKQEQPSEDDESGDSDISGMGED